jgi:hypothetical protein
VQQAFRFQISSLSKGFDLPSGTNVHSRRADTGFELAKWPRPECQYLRNCWKTKILIISWFTSSTSLLIEGRLIRLSILKPAAPRAIEVKGKKQYPVVAGGWARSAGPPAASLPHRKNRPVSMCRI